MIEVSVARRVNRGIAIWCDQGAEIRPIPAGGLSVPSCSEPDRIYKVSLADEGRCSCADWRYRIQPCEHVFAALIWAAKQRRALVLAEQRRAACRFEVYHCVPRCLPSFYDRFVTSRPCVGDGRDGRPSIVPRTSLGHAGLLLAEY